MDSLLQDVRYGLRSLRRTPGFTAAAVLMLALAVGLNGTLLALADRLLFVPPTGIAHPEQVVRIEGAMLRRPDQFTDLSQHLRMMTIAGQTGRMSLSVGRGADATPIQLRYVTRNYFAILGMQPLLGRTFTPEENQPAAIVGHGFWRRQLGGEAGVLGSALVIADRTFTIIAVAPPGFTGVDPGAVDVWLPEEQARRTDDGFWNDGGFLIAGRLAPGATSAQARAELLGRYPGDARPPGAVTPLFESLTTRLSNLNAVVVYLLGAGGVFLLIACANVSGLLVNRAFRRRHEIAVRLHLGATRGRVVRQILTEILLLNAGAGLLALGVVLLSAPALERILQMPLPGQWRQTELSAALASLSAQHATASYLTARVLGGAALLMVLTSLLSSLVPTLYVSKPDRTRWLNAQRGLDIRRSFVRQGLLALQVALTLVLLVATGLFVRSFQRAVDVDLGADYDDVLIASVDLPQSEYLRRNVARSLEEMASAVRTLPQVTHAALSGTSPIGAGKMHIAQTIRGYDWPWGAKRPAGTARTFTETVSPDYFGLLGLRLSRGRLFTEADHPGSPPVVVIDERLAREVFRGDDPLGKCVEFYFDPAAPGRRRPGVCRAVVGVVSSVRPDVVRDPGIDGTGEFDPAFYVPISQWSGARHLLIRTSADPGPWMAAIREHLQKAAPSLPHVRLERLSLYRDQQTHGWRVASVLFGVFGVLALVLATAGIYTVLAFMVRQRTVEIGIRLALGATPGDILRMSVVQGMAPVLVGIAGGLAAAAAITRLLESLLFGVSPMDTGAVLGAALLTGLAGWLACLAPAAAASRADPAVSLRHD
jgi:predicted permease